jgi:hypothetical protein
MTVHPYNPADDPDVTGQDPDVAPGTEPPKPEPDGGEPDG